MSTIAAKKCVRHPVREAVARCSSCREHFCRECVVEHTGVLFCATCLVRESAQTEKPRSTDWHRVGRFALTVACGLFLWAVFYGLGQFLKSIPPDLHEGTVWKNLHGS